MDINTRDEILQTLVHRVDLLEREVAEYKQLTSQIAHQVNKIVLYLASVQKACEQGDNEE